MGVDLNLHGGYAHNNRIDHILFDIPLGHKWKPIEHCPPHARWAPPDGENEIERQTIDFPASQKEKK
jgi:hypothetical protein